MFWFWPTLFIKSYLTCGQRVSVDIKGVSCKRPATQGTHVSAPFQVT